ncbi:MAG: hypothetical protein EOP38_29925 [Rubrivivax sp.]|nr:MAG: hypothetical protein EOP38_29925 [Rubrivivax sp.]
MSTNYAIQYSKVWWGLIALLVAMLIWHTGYDVIHYERTKAHVAVFNLVSNVLYIIPIVGYVRQKPYRPRWLWQVVFWTALILSGSAFAGLVVAITMGSVGIMVALAGIAHTAFAVLCLFPIHAYVSTSPHLWSTAR